MKITEALLAEHVVFHGLFDHIEKITPALKTLSEVKSIAALLEDTLSAHSRTEDTLLIEPMDHCLEQMGQAEGFHKEHREIDASLAQIKLAREVSVARKLLLSAVAYSRNHFDKEERILFPLAEKVLKSKTLTTLAADWIKQRQEAAVPNN
jgi:hemerythrin-like domain-containing protein